MELAPKGRVYPCKHHVEDMVVPFHGSLLNDATLLEQVIDNSAPANFVCLVEIDLHPLSKSRGVVITERLCVSEGLEYRVALHDLVGNGLLPRSSPGGNLCQVLQDFLGSLGLSCSGLPRNEHGLGAKAGEQGVKGFSGNCVDVGCRSIYRVDIHSVVLNPLCTVNGKCLEWVYGYKNRSNVSIDLIVHETLTDVMQNRALAECIQIHKVFHVEVHGHTALVHLGDLVRPHHQGLAI
mmetsp:Transcript_7022/g.14242  ORF Transcript_7022/g.14242 Transcript_7022/m.14242 type:complete len:237 (-) Transcript_7022:117-827(-)